MGEKQRQNKTHVKAARQVPGSVGINALRSYSKRASQAMVGAVLAFGASNIAKDPVDPWPWKTLHPDGTESQASHFIQEAKNVESHFSHRKIVPLQMEGLAVVHPYYAQPHKAGGYSTESFNAFPNFFMLSVSRIEATISDRLQPLEQEYETGAFGLKVPDPRSAINQAVLFKYAFGMNRSLHGGSLGVAMPTSVFQEDGFEKGCTAHSMPFYMDKSTFVKALSHSNGSTKKVAIEAELEEVREFVDNHELIHCAMAFDELRALSREQNLPWFNESVADLYALSRHIQKHGLEDGFAHDVMAIREMGALASVKDSDDKKDSMRHYTVPVLQRALPHLEAAYENGELEGKNPRELMEFALARVFRNPEEPRAAENIHREFVHTKDVYIGYELYDQLREIEDQNLNEIFTNILEEQGLTINDLKEKEAILNQSVETLYDSLDLEADLEPQLAAVYQENIDEVIRAQPSPQQAYVAVSYLAFRIGRQAASAPTDHAMSTEDYLATRGVSGLSKGRELEILHEKRAELQKFIEDIPEQKAPQTEPAPEV